MPVIYQHIERSFTTEEVLGILHNPDWSRVIREPPVKPRGGQVFLYHYTEESKIDDWRCDQYHFKHDGLRKQPRTNPKFYKNFFIVRTNHSKAKGDKRFKKHAYILIGDHKNLVLFQYLGDESVAQDLPHGNSKNASLLYTRLCPSVIEAIKDITVPSREVLQTLEEQARSSAVPEVHKPRSLLQISNTRSRVKRRSRTGKKKTRRKKRKKKEDPGTKHETVVSPCLATTYLPDRISAKPSAEADVTLSPDAMSPQTRIAALAQLCENIYQENMVKTSNEEAQNSDRLVIDKGYDPAEAIDAEPSAQTGNDESGINNMSNPNTDTELEVTDTSLVFEVGRTVCIPLANEDRDSNRLAETHKVCDIIQDSGISSSNMLVCDVQNSIDSDTNYTEHGGLGTRYTPVCSLPSTADAPNNLEHHIEVMDSNQLHRILALVRETLQMVSPGTETCLSSNTKVTSTASVNESNGDVSTLQQGGPCAVLQQGTSLPHTAVSLIAQVSSTWATDFQSIKQSLLRSDSLGSVIQTHLELLDLIAAVIVGAYKTSTDCLTFVETLKNYPSHLERHLSRQLPTDVVDKSTKYRIGNYTISGTDILRLDGNSWLDDSVIHAFLHLLKKQYTEERQRDVKILECFQYKLWEKGNYSEWLYGKDQFSSFDCILMPICVSNHWVLLAANVSNRTVCIINSQTSRNLSPQVTQHWMKFMQFRSRTTGEELSVWRPLQQPVFPQTECSSCGVFVLMAAEALVAGIPPGIMRTCHVAMYRRYVKQRLVSAAEVVQTATMEDVAIAGIDGAKPVDMVDISSERHIDHSQGCEQEDLTVPTDEALQITTEAINSTEVMTYAALPCDHRPGNAQADLAEGQSEDEESGKSGSDREHADDCKETITEEEEMMDASTEHVSDEECDEHAALGKPNTSVLIDCTPLPALAQCEAIYRNERLHFTALTLLCMEKGRLHLSDLTEVSESLQSHITWSCQLSGVEELSPVQVKTCLLALNTTVVTIDDDVVQFRQEKTLSHIKDILTNTSVEYMAKVDLEFIYLHVKLHHTDASMDEEQVFTLSLDRARQKDLAQRFAQEIIKHNFAFTLSHQAAGKHTFCVQVARLIKQYMQTGSMTELFASPDIKHGGNFLNWLCFGRNAELYKVLWMFIPEVAKEECLIYCCVSGNLDVLQLLLEDMDIKDVLSLKPKMQEVEGIHSCGIKTQALATHYLPALHLSSYYGHTDIVKCLLELGCDINAQLPDEFDGREGPVPPGSTPAAAATSGGHTAVLQCLIDHHAAMNLVDCNNNSLLHLACKGGHTDAVMLLISECDTSARNIDGNTPLHLACEERKLRVVEVLLKTNGDVTLLNYQAFTPFDIICQKGYLDIAILVLNATSYPLPHDGYNTPLHAACRGGYTELVKILLRYNSNRSVCNNTSRMNCRFESSRPLMFSMSGNDVKQTPFFEACKNGHIDIVRLLIEKGADVSAAAADDDDDCYTALHLACKNGHVDIVRLLIEKGADVSAAAAAVAADDDDGYTALHLACKNGHIDIVRLLIEKGADVSAAAAAIAAADDDGYTALHLACKNAHIDIVRLLIEKGADVSAASCFGSTALHLACENGHIDIVRLLIEKGADVSAAAAAADDDDGYTALQWACENGHIDIVRLLIEKGADVSAASCFGSTALHLACDNGHVDIVRLLIEKGADVSPAGNGYTPLHLACENGHIDIVRLLIEKGADVSAAGNGYTPLHWACENGNIDIVRLLIEKGADVSAAGNGYTALHWACKNGHIDIVRLLIEKGADVSAAADDDDDGYTPLHWACENGHIDIVRLLIEKGADVSATNRHGNTPLSLACENGHIYIVRLLIEKSADVSATNRHGYTPLTLACKNGHIDFVRLLIEKSADVSATNRHGDTPLSSACENGHIDIVRLLIEKGADVSATNRHGNTPLSLACENGHIDIVRLLIEKGADVSATNRHGYTPLSLACENGHIDIVRLLIEKGADVSATNRHGGTPLSLACENGHIDIVKLFEQDIVMAVGKCNSALTALVLKKTIMDFVNISTERNKPYAISCNTILQKCLKTNICVISSISNMLSTLKQYQDKMVLVKLLTSICNCEIIKNMLIKLKVTNFPDILHYALLQKAVAKSDAHCVYFLTRGHALRSFSDNQLLNMMVEAVQNKHFTVFQMLHNVPHVHDSSDQLVFHACKHGQVQVCNVLLSCGSCHSGRCLIAAFKVRNVVLVELLLKCDVDVNAYDGKGNSSLHLACELGDDKIVKLLIEKGQSVHGTNAQMETPLFAASRHGHVAVVKLVLSHGADITKTDIEGNSVLHCACLSGEVDLLQLFIHHISLKTKHVLGQGGPVSLSRVLYFSNKNGESLLHVACRNKHNQAVEILFQNKMSIYAKDNKGNTPVSMTEKQKSLFVVLCNLSCELQEKDSTGNTLLHIACDRGYIECVDVLCRRGANVSASNNKLEYAVHKVAESGSVEIMDILLAHEADINVTDIDKQTPLHLACAENNLEIVEILIRNKADVNVCDKHHVTPLHLACRDGFTEIAAVLLKAFVDDGVVSENNVTPLVCACEGGHINCVKLLLRAGANVNVTGHRGNTPLHRASAQGHESVVKVLLSCGADPLQGNINGKLPLHHAVLWGHLGIVKVLIDKCKSYLMDSSNMLLLLESVCSRGYVEILKSLMEFFDQFLMPPKNMFHLIKTSIISNHTELLTILEGKGCNIQQRDDRGWSILQVVCESEGIDQTSLDKVLELGFDLREITEHGESLLHIACKMDNIETVKHLIEKGANVHSKDNSGDTVLHVACAHGYFDTATVLIKKGLSINEKNLKGLTSLDIAIANKHYGVTCLYDPYYALSNSRPRISMMSLHHICRDKKPQLLYNFEIVFSEVDSDGNSALHISCLEDSDEIVQLLVIAGAWLNLRNTLGEAPVHVACRGTFSCLKAMTDAIVNRDLLKTVVSLRDRNNNTPLHTVAHERKFEHLCLLLEKGADVNLANNFDQTALHIACYVGDANIVLTLLNARANILAKDKCGNTPLHIICTGGNLSLLRLINHNEAVIATRNYEGRTPLHEAVNRGYHSMILYMMTKYWHFTQSDLSEEGLQDFIIRMGREDFTKLLMGETICPDSEGNTPLHHAAETKSLVIVRTLMRRGYSCQATNELGETPLFNACLKGSAAIVELFLKEGSPPYITNDNSMTPLHVACQTGHVDIVVLLFDYDPDLGARTHLGQTVLHLACMSGSADVVEVLLKAGSDINARDNNLDTPLHMAAIHGKVDSIILLAKWGARDVQCNQQGDLALHHACREGRSDAVKTLLNIDSDASVLNHQGVSPVMLACDRDCESILELLLQRLLVEVQIESVQPTDDSVHEKYVTNLNYCLYCACKHNYLRILQLLIKYNVDIYHTFTDAELKLINRQSIEELSQSENEHRTLQPTALHIACYRGHATCVETLMRSGALSESKTSSGDTPLHVACIHGHDDTVALLLNKGISASPVSDNGTTPLHYACRGGFEDVVSRLLAAGADPDAEDGDGKTPLAVSRGGGVADMFLKSHGSSRKRGKDTSQAAEIPPQKVSKE
ncbi:uncharacterized protein [Haliotis cracherodii]|uniref:uncharacterized protein n=1 Tax=Haliotis cracherodii TaxID=6455 RepID=UPI0039E8F71D